MPRGDTKDLITLNIAKARLRNLATTALWWC